MKLQWYQWMALVALGICLVACLLHLARLLRYGKPADYSRPAGKTSGAILYAFTGAMSPAKKESAYLHLPTYTAGLFYHMGTFLSIILFFLIILEVAFKEWVSFVLALFLGISAFSGMAILVKRILKKELKTLSNPDDYISNILVTLFQFMTVAVLLTPIFIQSYSPAVIQSSHPTVQPSNWPAVQLIYYLLFTLLALYIPVGKLRHAVYFFAARYHLGYFFGWRGIWPPRNVKG